MTEIKDTLREFFGTQVLDEESMKVLTDTTPLLTGGILDSLSLIRLVAFIEEEFEVEVAPHEASVRHFDDLESIVQLIQGKR